MASRPDPGRPALRVEDNLRSLGVERLGAVNLRVTEPDHLPAGVDPVPLEDQLAAMVALRDEGKIAGVGISMATLEQVETAIRLADIVCVQNAFSLVTQGDAEVLDRCSEAGIAYVPYFPLGSAIPGLPKDTEQPQVIEVARVSAPPPPQVGLAWLLQRSDNVLLIPGTSSLAHLEENLTVAELELSTSDLALLGEVSAG